MQDEGLQLQTKEQALPNGTPPLVSVSLVLFLPAACGGIRTWESIAHFIFKAKPKCVQKIKSFFSFLSWVLQL